ncbi:arsenate-mycothiol transferase ArsC [Govanella unica]|uniref:Arsenate reductase ArsC n=1 Tax=Govanella unica TaxID=2975056 RepID=A0A9X3TZM2_9PROT|nr:arsenate reductase ArsC [Govania unica]MDA5194513.1 arsenate reductase ArsC [Govania unica]
MMNFDGPSRPTSNPTSVLFACSMNRVRSPMAEAIAKYLLGKRIFIDSVGVRKGEVEPDPLCLAVLDEIGLDLSRHRSKTFDELQDASFDLVISLSPEAQHNAVELTRHMACEVEYWPTPDPTAVEGSREARLAAYRQVRDLLMDRIRTRFGIAPPSGV